MREWLICGTVPDESFPLCLGSWEVDGDMLVPHEVEVCSEGHAPRAVPILRGTPALAAAAILACNARGCNAPKLLLTGDCGKGGGSLALYSFLAARLPDAGFLPNLGGMTFHYLFPNVDGHNRILMAIDERPGDSPTLVADAGFMYAAKMSGYAARWDIFTPDAGELSFLADEKAPHPFYTRGFLLGGDQPPEQLAALAHAHGDSARHLLIKGSTDLVVRQGCVAERIESPSIPYMEPIGGTGDLVTGLLTAALAAGKEPVAACTAAARGARIVGSLAQPTPAWSIAMLMPYIKEALAVEKALP